MIFAFSTRLTHELRAPNSKIGIQNPNEVYLHATVDLIKFVCFWILQDAMQVVSHKPHHSSCLGVQVRASQRTRIRFNYIESSSGFSENIANATRIAKMLTVIFSNLASNRDMKWCRVYANENTARQHRHFRLIKHSQCFHSATD